MPEWKDVPPCPSPSSLYSAQRNLNKVTSMTVNDLEQFMGIVFTMSIMKLPQTRMYWPEKFRIDQVADTMTRDRWKELKQSLHFNDNREAPDQDDPERHRLYKIRPLRDHLVAKCRELPKSQKTVCG
ncbi:hypothetical protein MRX96_006350 [Rhipicephalus microplus]